MKTIEEQTNNEWLLVQLHSTPHSRSY
jgi:hypothetical protein